MSMGLDWKDQSFFCDGKNSLNDGKNYFCSSRMSMSIPNNQNNPNSNNSFVNNRQFLKFYRLN